MQNMLLKTITLFILLLHCFQALSQEDDEKSNPILIEEITTSDKDLPLENLGNKYLFTLKPPQNWIQVEKEQLPENIQMLYLEDNSKQKHKIFVPNFNVSIESLGKYTLEEVVEKQKESLVLKDQSWTSLGEIKNPYTHSQLMLVHSPQNWGEVKHILAYYAHDKLLYCFTGSCTKENFSEYFPIFLDVIESFKFEKK